MNKKGFTLVELLAVICILGILGTIGVVSTSRYLVQSRKKSYLMMSQSVYEAAMNCMIQSKCQVPTSDNDIEISTDILINYGYIENLVNPLSNNSDCKGKVVVKNLSDTGTEYEKYQYYVQLTCSGLANNILIWPDEKKNKDSLKKIGVE